MHRNLSNPDLFAKESLLLEINTRADLASTCDKLSGNSRIKVLHLALSGGANDVKPLCNMLVSNYCLQSLQLSGQFEPDAQAQIIRALRHNFDITEFSMTNAAPENASRIQGILQRNLHFKAAQHVLIEKFLQDTADCRQEPAEYFEKLQPAWRDTHTADEVSEVMFNIRMRSHGKPAELACTYDVQLKKLKLTGKTLLQTALHVVASPEYSHFAAPLLARLENVNVADDFAHTPLHLAAIHGNHAVAELLCARGADKSRLNDRGETAAAAAVANRYPQIAAYLEPDTDTNKIKAKHDLIVGYGVALFKSTAELAARNIDHYGGTEREGFALLAEYLTKFAALHDNAPELAAIAARFSNAAANLRLTVDEQIEQLAQHGVIHTVAGYLMHIMGITLEKMPGECLRMVIAERGAFAKRAAMDAASGKFPALQQLVMPEKLLREVLTELKDSLEQSPKQIEQFLFVRLPQLAGSNWQYLPASQQSPLKAGVCFYGNLKTLVLYDCLKAFGDETGKEVYKAFTTFLRSELLKDYLVHFPVNDPFAVVASVRLERRLHAKTMI
jgi:hypothetical protein